jgi:hypothetical protein
VAGAGNGRRNRVPRGLLGRRAALRLNSMSRARLPEDARALRPPLSSAPTPDEPPLRPECIANPPRRSAAPAGAEPVPAADLIVLDTLGKPTWLRDRRLLRLPPAVCRFAGGGGRFFIPFRVHAARSSPNVSYNAFALGRGRRDRRAGHWSSAARYGENLQPLRPAGRGRLGGVSVCPRVRLPRIARRMRNDPAGNAALWYSG